MKVIYFAAGLLAMYAWLNPSLLCAQSSSDRNQLYDEALYESLSFRMVGPFRGGRSTAVAGIPGQPTSYLMGTTGGGVWKTTDDGVNWENISDGFFEVGSIGALDVAPSDLSTIYAGTGSACIRGNTSTGRGMYKSLDGGKTWQFSGLREAGQIGDVVVHPGNADLVYVAAMGHPFGKNEMRGVFRSNDGGETWEHVLALSDSTGAVSLSMNPSNPREIYAGMWRGERKPWTLISGSTEGGVYKTMDGGDTWKKLGGGLPEGVVGKVGVSISPANPDRVWAIIEAEPEGGVYRSDDAGESWTRLNSENKLRQRAWYYTHVVADPADEHTVYVLNTRLYRSVDGGKTFEVIEVPHGDVHDLWINPQAPKRMVVANDGGAQTSVNAGDSWSTMYNQPTAELYGVVVDNGFPYRLYGAQQDNTTISVPAWTSSNTLYAKEHWYSIGGCETGPIALHPDHPDVIYAGCYGGVMDRYDRTQDQVRNIMLYPQLQLGEAAKNLKHRFQWVSPMAVSPHDPNTIFHGSQMVNRSNDAGRTWETISGDLTTNNPAHQDYSGGPINHDITGVEIYNTLFAITPSPHEENVIWVGSDDGRIHISQDTGGSWRDVTPGNMPALGTVNHIEVSPHDAGTAYLAVQRYRMDDFSPYIFRTRNYGRSWNLLSNDDNGIPDDYPVRVVREDPDRQGLLYAGTEFGLFVSFDDGAHWQSLQLDLPVTPITDLRVAHQDLILSTQGRSFWVLDDVTPLHQITNEVAASRGHLFAPRDAYRVNDRGDSDEYSPDARPHGALINYFMADSVDVDIAILNEAGDIVTRFSTDSTQAEEHGVSKIESKSGGNRVVWDLTYPGPEMVEGAVVWGYTGGVKAPPGEYRVRLSTSNGVDQTQSFSILKDPRLTDVTQEDFEEQFVLAMQVRDTLNQVQGAMRRIVAIKDQIAWITERAKDAGQGEAMSALAGPLGEKLTEVENLLHQTQNQSNQDPIRFAPRLDNQFIELYNNVTGVDGYISGGSEGRISAGARTRFEDLKSEWLNVREQFQRILDEDVAAFNRAFEDMDISRITIPKG